MGLDLLVGCLSSDPPSVLLLLLPRLPSPPPSLLVVDASPVDSLGVVSVCPGSFCVSFWLRAIGG